MFFSRRDVLITNVTSFFTLQIAVDVSTVNHTGEATPCLELSIKGLRSKVVMHPWDLTASASLGSMAVKEMTFGSDGAPLYLVQTPAGAELLSVKFVKVNENVLTEQEAITVSTCGLLYHAYVRIFCVRHVGVPQCF